MPRSLTRYCALGIHWADSPFVPEVLCIEGDVVVFETTQMAREVVPRLAPGRLDLWDTTKEVCTFAPHWPQGIFAVSILTGYDPYDVPNGFRAKGIWSEAEARDWQHHVLWSQCLPVLRAWADDLAERFDPMLQAQALELVTA